MKIEKIKLKDLKQYENNAKIHTDEQIEHIINSINKFGFNDPIAVWGKDNLIIEGHGRYLALNKMGAEDVDIIRLDHLTEDERKAYTLAHNQLNLVTGFDFEILDSELAELENMNMEMYGFNLEDFEVKDRLDLSENIKDSFEIIVECISEFDLEQKYNFLTKEGFECRISTL